MSNVLSFLTAPRNESRLIRPTTGNSCQVVIFPGIRRERREGFEVQAPVVETKRSN